jgi:hypothetical protein
MAGLSCILGATATSWAAAPFANAKSPMTGPVWEGALLWADTSLRARNLPLQSPPWNVLLCVPSLIEEMRLQLVLATVSPHAAPRALLLQWARLGVWSSSETNSRNVCLIGHRRVLG